MFSMRRPSWPKRKDFPPAPPVDYEEIGDEVSVEGTICQAAQAIDIAGKLAAEERDSERLLDAAAHWTKLADFIVALSEHQEKRRDKKAGVPMGFQPTDIEPEEEKHDIMAEEGEEEIVRDDED